MQARRLGKSDLEVSALGARKGATPAQVALAWLLAQKSVSFRQACQARPAASW